MDRSSYGDGAPIVAIATPLAESALAVVRTSGPGAIELAAAAFSRPVALRGAAGNTIVHGWIIDTEGNRIDEVVASVFRGPRSYTGEDAVDFSCHGGIAVSRAVHECLVEAGFRGALPGEFTFRAFLNGKIDLTRSESVMELVSAKTDEGRSHAIGRLSGALETEIKAIKDLLVEALAATELFLDYSEDDGVGMETVEGDPTKDTHAGDEAAGILPQKGSVKEARNRLKKLIDSYRVERLYRDGATIAVAGRPNAGKSKLFNRLIREERSIVAATPGTTRDWIEAWISIEGIPLRLVDTAGLRDAADPIERAGVERSLDVLEGADLILYIVDGTEGRDTEDDAFLAEERKIPVLPIWNKIDRGAPHAPEGYIPVSAAQGDGIPDVAARIVQVLEGRSDSIGHSDRVGIASERQKDLIDRALAATEESLDLAEGRAPLDLIAIELRGAVDALGEITGEVSTADILETMFGRFCVGK